MTHTYIHTFIHIYIHTYIHTITEPLSYLNLGNHPLEVNVG